VGSRPIGRVCNLPIKIKKPWVDQTMKRIFQYSTLVTVERISVSSFPQGWFVFVDISRCLLMNDFSKDQNWNNKTVELTVMGS
jgi:hypothetical protein